MKHAVNMTVITGAMALLLAPALCFAQAPAAPAAPAAGQRVGEIPLPGGQPAAPAQPAAPSVKVERGAGGKKVYRITEAIRIEGKIQKPEAFYVLQKSSIDYDWEELRQEFVPKIVDSVSKAPF
jgi:hypothetical protein